MKRKIFIWFALAVILSACEKENLTPSENCNPFAPDAEATDAGSKLRREFYEKTGTFLLFNDTLRHEYAGKDAFGNPYYDTELLAMEWELGTVKTSHVMRYEYLNAEQQQKAYDFLLNDFVPYVNKLPYSIFAVNRMELKKEDDYDGTITWTPQTVDINSRCMAVAIEGLFAGDIEPKEYAQDFCCAIIFSSFGGSEEEYWRNSEAYEFHKVNSMVYYYGYAKAWYHSPLETLEDLYKEGFIADSNGDNLPTALQDASAYIKAILSMTDLEFREKYGQYSSIMTKYEIMKPLAEKKAELYGIKFK